MGGVNNYLMDYLEVIIQKALVYLLFALKQSGKHMLHVLQSVFLMETLHVGV